MPTQVINRGELLLGTSWRIFRVIFVSIVFHDVDFYVTQLGDKFGKKTQFSYSRANNSLESHFSKFIYIYVFVAYL